MALGTFGQGKEPPHGRAEAARDAAERVSSAFPALLVEAERIAQTVAHGIHGRRRAGTGETFWQYKQYRFGDSASAIDWRRSARSDEVYVRENEWEAANTVWLWTNVNASMEFKSHLSEISKKERAVIVTLALANLLLQAGERVGMLGLTHPPSHHLAAMRRFAHYLTDDTTTSDDLPPSVRIPRFSTVVLVGDFLQPIEDINQRFGELAGRDIQGHVVQILDPAEETLPYEGRKEFAEISGPLKLTIGKVEGLRGAYHEKVEAHRKELNHLCRRLGWTFAVHHTDVSPHQALLSLYGRLSGDFATGRASVGGA